MQALVHKDHRPAVECPSAGAGARAGGIAEGHTLITGAASGIGRALARALGERGHRLVLVDVQAELLERVADELRGRDRGPRVRAIVQDLGERGAARAVFDACQSERLEITTLVNNAAAGAHAPFHEMPLCRMDQIVRVNVTSVLALTRLLLPAMVARRSGTIVNVTSIAAFQSSPYLNVYGATKAFLQNFTETLQAELHGKGVYVTAVCPGMTRTNFFAACGMQPPPAAMQSPEEVVEEALAGMARRLPLIVTGRSNRIRIQFQRANLRRLVAHVKGGLRRVGVLS